MGFVLILGGARSGKSGLADRLGRESGGPVRFIATATPEDPEMEERIRRHRDTRPPHWSTVEEPVDLQAAIRAGPVSDFVIVDCLTLWVSNLLGAGRGPVEIRAMAGEAALELALHRGVVVTNEVGLGIVPDNALARSFRDAAGLLNQNVAAVADEVEFVVAGLPMKVK